MVTDQQEIKSLDAGLDCTIILLGLLMAAAWLFALFSYNLSRKTGTDWFSRSGAMMSLIGAAITFRQVNVYQSAPRRRSRKASYRYLKKSSFASSRPHPTGCFRTSAI